MAVATCFVDDDFTLNVVEDTDDTYGKPETIEEPVVEKILNFGPDEETDLPEDPLLGFTCEICTFKTKHRLIFHNHIESHRVDNGSNSKSLRKKCKYCNVEMDGNSTVLKQHTFECFMNKKEIHYCSNCDFKTFQRTQLTRHEKMFCPSLKKKPEKNKKELRCSICSFTIDRHQSKIFMLHMSQQHLKPYKCKSCFYFTDDKDVLEKHQRTHFKYLCELCIYGTNKLGDFNKHIHIHMEKSRKQ